MPVGTWNGKAWVDEKGTVLSTDPNAGRPVESESGGLDDFISGIGKGAGETAFNLGSLVHKTPLLGQLTDALAKAVGPEGTDPNAAFSKLPDQLEAKNTAEKLGKGAEQIGEFFIPAGPARLEAIEQIVKRLPNVMSPATAKMANKAAALAGRTLGEAGSSAAISKLHGGEDTGTEAMLAGSGPLLAEGWGNVAGSVMKSPLGRRVLPYLGAATAMNALGGVTGEGVGAGLAGFGLIRGILDHLTRNPQALPFVQRGGRRLIESGARAAAGVVDQTTPKRRQLAMD